MFGDIAVLSKLSSLFSFQSFTSVKSSDKLIAFSSISLQYWNSNATWTVLHSLGMMESIAEQSSMLFTPSRMKHEISADISHADDEYKDLLSSVLAVTFDKRRRRKNHTILSIERVIAFMFTQIYARLKYSMYTSMNVFRI